VGRWLYRAAEGASTCGPGVPRGLRRRASAGLRIEPGSRSGMTPTGGARLVVREWKGEESAGLGGLGRAGGERKHKGRLGWALREEGER
jgi:hypothetical protein